MRSIRHRWAEEIYRRTKTDELRKTTPRDPQFWLAPIRMVRIYEPEIGMVTGVFTLMCADEIESAEDVLRYNTALELEEIEAYGPGRDGFYHIWRTAWAERFQQPLPLSVFGLARPPQSWQYINEEGP